MNPKFSNCSIWVCHLVFIWAKEEIPGYSKVFLYLKKKEEEEKKKTVGERLSDTFDNHLKDGKKKSRGFDLTEVN